MKIDVTKPIPTKPLYHGPMGPLWTYYGIKKPDKWVHPKGIAKAPKKKTPEEKWLDMHKPQRWLENVYIWDMEAWKNCTPRPGDEERHVKGRDSMYSVGIVKASKRLQHIINKVKHTGGPPEMVHGDFETDEEYGSRMICQVQLFFGTPDAESGFINYLKELNQQLEDKVNKRFLRFKEKFIKQKTDAIIFTIEKLSKEFNMLNTFIVIEGIPRESAPPEVVERWERLKEDITKLEGYKDPEVYFKNQLEAERYRYVHKYQARFYGYNAARYDTIFLFKMMGIFYRSVLPSHGLVAVELFQGLIVFVDMMRMTGPCKLSQLCKDMKIPEAYSKTEFPHDFASADTLNYRGPVPEAKYWPSGEVPAELQGEKDWDFQQWCMHYQKLDVIASLLCWDKFSKTLYDAIGFTTSDFLTAPSLAYQYVLEHTYPDQIEIITDHAIDDWLRKGIFGGRCFIQKAYFESSDIPFDELQGSTSEETKANIEKYIADNDLLSKFFPKSLEEITADIKLYMDVTSLYPTAMRTFPYPTGKPHWELDLEGVRKQLNELTMERLGFIECTIDFPNKDVVTPLIATKSTPLRYTLEDNQYVYACTIDVMEAIKHNDAVVTQVFKALVWDGQDFIFREAIDKLWGIRKKAKQEGNKALDVGAKVMLNSSYGKTIQKKPDKTSVIMSDNDLIDDLYLKGRIVGDYTMPNQEQCLIEKKLANCEKAIKYPAHLGVFILAYSKRIVNDILTHTGGFKDWTTAMSYGDTDSAILHAREVKRIPEELLGNELGQFHEDIPGRIIREYNIAPKNNIQEYVTREGKVDYKRTGKGIPRKELDKLTIDDYRRMMMEHKEHKFTYEEYKRDYKHVEEAAITRISKTKVINSRPWQGRIHDPNTGYWHPYGGSYKTPQPQDKPDKEEDTSNLDDDDAQACAR
jgi:hypothetical protein